MNNAGAKTQSLTLSGGLTLAGTSTLSLAFDKPLSATSRTIVTTGAGGITNAFNSVIGITSGVAGTDYTIRYTNGTTPTDNPGAGALLNAPSNQIIVVFNTTNVTPVKLDAFTARASADGISLTWHSVSEFQNAGYVIYRRAVGSEEWNKVNQTLIGGRFTNADEHTYRLFDWAAAGRYEYRLETISLKGELESYTALAGPVEIDSLGLAFNALTEDSLPSAAQSAAAEIQSARVAAVNALFNSANAIETSEVLASVLSAQQAASPATPNVPSPSATARALNPNNTADMATLGSRAASLVPAVSTFDASVAARWFTPARATGTTTSAVKIVYSTPGVLAITQASLPNGFNIGHVSITREGKPVPALAIKNGTLYVYAPGYADDYTDKDALFLRKIAGNTAVSANTTAAGLYGQPANTSAPATVTATYHDVYFDFSTNFRPYNYPPWFSAQYLTDGTDQSFTLGTPGAGSNAATLTVNLWSLTTDPNGASPDHALQVVVNGHRGRPDDLDRRR